MEMELTNRLTLERDFLGSLDELTGEQRERLRRYLGQPPNPANVPDSFWQEVRRDTHQRIAAVAYLLFIAAAEEHADFAEEQLASRMSATQQAAPAVSDRRFDISAAAFAQQQAAKMAEGYGLAVRERFERFADLVRDRQSADDALSLAELDEELRRIFTPSSAERIASTVTTAAQTAGGNVGVGSVPLTGAQAWTRVWSVHPELTRDGPCPRCAALDGHAEDEWAAIDAEAAGGAPLHDYCACTNDYVLSDESTPQ